MTPQERDAGPNGGRAEPRGSTLPMSEAGAKEVDPGALTRLQDNRSPARYTLLGEIARGGMGIVLHVWDEVLKRPLAMKILDLHEAASGSDGATRSVARFLAEARLSGSLEHPGVVPVHDLGVDENGRTYFTMPLIEGRDLNEVFDLAANESEGWSLTRALIVLTRICEVVAYAHSRNVLHRDLKPANVMVGKFGETYVMDWGLAKSVGAKEPEPPADAPPVDSAEDAARTVDGTVFGTPGYMAPEQAHGKVGDVSFLTDVYSLGAMLYRLLAGRSPYAPRHGKEEAARTLELVRRGPPTPLARVAPKTPPELIAIAEKAMAREPGRRYESVQSLANDLQAFLEGRVVGAYEGGLWAETKSLVRRNRVHAAWIGGLLVIGFATMVVVTWVHAALNDELERANAELLLARADVLPEEQLTGEERELASQLADSSVYGDELRARTSWEVLAEPGAPPDDYLEALEHLREAARLVPGDIAIQARLGAALVRAGEPASGLEVLERALRGLDELDRARAQAFLGLAYCALGRDVAASELRRGLRSSLDESRDPDLRALVDELDRCLEERP